MNMDEMVLKKLKERYSHVHPTIFHRSCAYAKSPGDLFDILESLPKVYPIVWQESKRQWITVEDICKLNVS